MVKITKGNKVASFYMEMASCESLVSSSNMNSDGSVVSSSNMKIHNYVVLPSNNDLPLNVKISNFSELPCNIGKNDCDDKMERSTQMKNSHFKTNLKNNDNINVSITMIIHDFI